MPTVRNGLNVESTSSTLLLLARHPLLFIGGFGTVQSIFVVSSTRPEMLGRGLAVSIGFSPIDNLHLGWPATQFGTDTAVLTIAVTGIVHTAAPILIFRISLRCSPRKRG